MSRNEEIDLEALAAVLHRVPPERPSAGLRRRILESVHPASRYAGFGERLAALFDLDAESLGEVLARARRPSDAAWFSVPIPGLRVLHVEGGPETQGSACALVRMEPGTPFPDHGHVGEERALILDGLCEESRGGLYLPGDSLAMDAGSRHSLRAEGREPLLFAVRHAGIQF